MFLPLEKSGTSMMSLASPADDSVLDISRPLSGYEEEGGDTWWPVSVAVLSPLYTVVTELSGSGTVSPPLVEDISSWFSPLLVRFSQTQLPCHTCMKNTCSRSISFQLFFSSSHDMRIARIIIYIICRFFFSSRTRPSGEKQTH